MVNRFYTERQASPRIPEFFSIVRSMQWTAKEPLANGHLLQGIKILGRLAAGRNENGNVHLAAGKAEKASTRSLGKS